MRQIIRLNETQLIDTIKESVKTLFEGGHLYGTDNEGNVFTNSRDTYRGVPGSTVISHGEWSDPEVIYKGKSVNYNDIEDLLWELYQNETGGDEDSFGPWLEEKGLDFIADELDNIVSNQELNESVEFEDPKDTCMRLVLQALDNLTVGEKKEFYELVASALGIDDMAIVKSIVGKICRKEFDDVSALRNLIPSLESFITKVYGTEDDEEENLGGSEKPFDYESLGDFPLNEVHGKKHRGPKDYMSAIRKGNRDAEMEKMGGGFRQKTKVHKTKNDYPGKKVDITSLDDLDESVKKLKSIIRESVKRTLRESNELDRLAMERSGREKEAKSICERFGYENFWYDYHLLCVELVRNYELSKLPTKQVWERGEFLQRKLRERLGEDCRVDTEIRGVNDDGTCISAYAKIYV